VNKLLIDDYPVQVLPKLAKEVGLNEAILLQQLHYWLNNKSAKFIDGKKWIYNTYEDWEKQFPFWSNATIRRTVNSCEKQKLILTANYNKAGFDKTKWYTVNYEEVNRMSRRVAQNEQTSCSKRADGVAQNEQTNTIDYTETTTETTKESKTPAKHPKKKYGEMDNVLLNDSELEKLKDKFPNDYEERIDKLSLYIAQKGKKYKSHYATILSWARRDDKQGQTSKNGSQNGMLDKYF
jgi:hypothetical protein